MMTLKKSFVLIICSFLISFGSYSQDCPDTCEYTVPTQITPDSDCYRCGYLEIESNCTFSEFEFTMFNRWGETIFQSIDPENQFDSSQVKGDIYAWKLSAIFCNSRVIYDTGHIIVLR
jgi:CHU_C Type IX secretion signal domain